MPDFSLIITVYTISVTYWYSALWTNIIGHYFVKNIFIHYWYGTDANSNVTPMIHLQYVYASWAAITALNVLFLTGKKGGKKRKRQDSDVITDTPSSKKVAPADLKKTPKDTPKQQKETPKDTKDTKDAKDPAKLKDTPKQVCLPRRNYALYVVYVSELIHCIDRNY